MERHKSRLPSETIGKIKSFMQDSGVVIVEHDVQHTGEFYSVLLQLEGTPLFVNGKGTTAEYATASAYGELMERLLTAILFRFNSIASERSVELDGKFGTLNGFDADIAQTLVGSRITREQAMEIQNFFFNADIAEFVSEEYTNLNDGSAVRLPMALVDSMYSSNGMAYGNDRNEASVQALSEVFERYVNREIIVKNLKPPVLENWRDYVADDLREKIEAVIETHDLQVEVRDCSLGGRYPVAGILVVNPQGQYFVKFGAHFTFEVALERCFTELFQGRSMERNFWKETIYEETEEFIHRNLEKVMKDGDGYYPRSFFEEIETTRELNYSFGRTNEEAHTRFMETLKSFGQPIYYRDYSKGDHTVVRFVVPGVSNVNLEQLRVLDWYREHLRQTDSILGFAELDSRERESLIEKLERKGVLDSQPMIRFLKLPVSFNEAIGYYTFGYLKGVHRVLNGQFDAVTESYFAHNASLLNNYRLIERNRERFGSDSDLAEAAHKALHYPVRRGRDLYVADKAISFSASIDETYMTFERHIRTLDQAVPAL